jgi:isoquinoline 1-oxidoreductase subunit alpha
VSASYAFPRPPVRWRTRTPARQALSLANSQLTSEEHPVPKYAFKLNGKNVSVDAPADMPLLWVLRDLLGVTGPKYGCGVGVCRACTCHVNGSAVQVCTLTAVDVVGKTVTTIEGLAPTGGLHPVQQAWIDEDVAQCGFCQPGQIMQAAALLKSKPSPSDADIDQIMNVCRCGTYCRIRKAIKRAATKK